MARHKMGSGKKRKSGAKKSTHRRRRIGASGKLEPVLMNAAGVGAGVVAIREVSILAGSLFPSLQASPVLTGIAELGIGILTAWKAKGGFLTYMGLGAAGNGVMTILNGAGIIGAGPATMTYQFNNRRAMGDPRLQFVAGPTTRIGDFPNNFPMVAGAGGIGARKKRYTS